MTSRSRIHWSGLLAFALILSTPAAASAASALSVAEQLRARGVDPSTVVLPFEIDESMRTWVRETVRLEGSERRLGHLLKAILERDGRQMLYQRGSTATAREAWQTSRANCLSFTHLYVGLAREVGLDVYYLRVSDVQRFEKEGDLVIASDHVTAAWGPPGQRRVLDFSDRPVTAYRDTEPISDLTAIALHYANVGAERIREGRLHEAEESLRLSVRIDPQLGDGWVNLGVALRRLGRTREAEASFRRAVEVDPRLVPGYNNLAVLLEAEDRFEEARRFRDLASSRRDYRDPFSYLALGDLAMRDGDLGEAGRLFQVARKLKPKHAEPLAALGQWALAVGRRDEAERWYLRASSIDPRDARVEALNRLLWGGSTPEKSEQAQM